MGEEKHGASNTGGGAVHHSGDVSSPESAKDDATVLAIAQHMFGDRMPIACNYAEVLATEGVVRGLIGPREAPRIWNRHLLNCVVVSERIPHRSQVVDIGSGAGLPGLVLAIARPDVTVTLVEPLARRASFLAETVESLGLANVTVCRARAEECQGNMDVADIVTARAVASLDRLSAWCLPLTKVGGCLLALKGASAAAEVDEHSEAIRRHGGALPVIHLCGTGVIEPPATVVEIVRQRNVVPNRLSHQSPSTRRRSSASRSKR